MSDKRGPGEVNAVVFFLGVVLIIVAIGSLRHREPFSSVMWWSALIGAVWLANLARKARHLRETYSQTNAGKRTP